MENTPEQIAQHYSAAMDSVNLINALAAQPTMNQDDHDAMRRNKEHLELMLTRDYWTTEDLTPFRNAVAVTV
jgi:hypothetical protein